jgi:hypothetical protein
MSLYTHGKEKELSLDGTTYLRNESYNIEPGYVGLSYGRVQDAAFSYLRIQNNNTDLRTVSDYINYVRSGGHLFVLNTNGYGSIAKYLFGNLQNPSLIKGVRITATPGPSVVENYSPISVSSTPTLAVEATRHMHY